MASFTTLLLVRLLVLLLVITALFITSLTTVRVISRGLLKSALRKKYRLSTYLYTLLGLTALVLSVVGCSLTDSFESPSNLSDDPLTGGKMPQTVRIGYQIIPNAEVLAKSLGLVEEAFPNTKIKWKAFPAGWKINEAMLAGEVDIGLVGSLPVSTAIAQNLPLKVYIIHNIIDDNAALAVTKASEIKSINDLSGKKIAVPFGSTAHFSLLSAIEQSDVKIQDVQILDMSLPEIIATWENDVIDGSFVWQTTLSKLLAKDGSTIITTAGDLIDQGATTADLGTVSDLFLAAYPQFLTKFVTVLDTATQFYRQKPTDAAAAISQELALSPETALSVMNEIIWLDLAQQSDAAYMGTPKAPGNISQVLKDSADFMAQQRAIPPAPDLETFQAALVNQTFAEAANVESANVESANVEVTN